MAVTSLLLIAPAPIDDGGPTHHQVSEERHERIRGVLRELGAEDVRSRQSGGVLYVDHRVPVETSLTPEAWQLMALEALATLVADGMSLVLTQHAAEGAGDDEVSTLSLDADDLEEVRQRLAEDDSAANAGTDSGTHDGGGDATDGPLEDSISTGR